VHDRLEHIGRRAERAVEEQRLAETDDVLGAFAGGKALRIDTAQPLARVDQIAGRRTGAKALEVCARGDEIRASARAGVSRACSAALTAASN